MGYVERDPQVKTKAKLEKVYGDQDIASGLSHDLISHLMAIGDDTSRNDFLWACDVVNRQLARVYRTEPKWRIAIQESDTFFFPLMAALGKAREQDAASQIEERKRAVVELLCAAEEGSDPLVLARPEGQCLASVLEGVRSNIGRSQRNIVYGAWRQYFRSGRATHGILLDWTEAAKLY
jgi:hypothetical protein